MVDVDGIGDILTNAGLSTSSLLTSTFEVKVAAPSNALLIELGRFQKKHSLANEKLLSWFSMLTNVTETLPPAIKFRKRVEELTAHFKKLQKNQTNQDGAAALDKFVNDQFGMNEWVKQCCTNSTTPIQSATNQGLQSQLAMLRRQLQEYKDECDRLKNELGVLANESKATFTKLQVTTETNISLAQQVIDEKNKSAQLKQKCDALQAELKIKKADIISLKKENVRRLKKLKSLNLKLQSTITRMNEKSFRSSYQKKKMLNNKQYVVAKLQITTGKKSLEKKQKVQFKKDNQVLRQRVTELESQLAGNIIRLKDPDTGSFTDAAKVCIMTLCGEHEIAAKRCGKVIQTVCRTILDAEVSEADLPSERTVGRCVDMGQVLTKMQIAETLTSSDRYDLHTDGTTKLGKKVVTQQVTTDSGCTLSCGFTVVASENAETLVSVATSFLEELTFVYETEEEKHQKFLEFLEKLNGLMSDRAAVMKCFNSRFSEMRQNILQTDEGLSFLYCNAHFLLGLSSCVDKVFKDLLGDGHRMGRETVAKFLNANKKEHPAVRYIREACACLGPRGDERFGCRQNWLAYCMMYGTQSAISSFKANRFNNLFQAAGALHYHQHDINSFLSTCMADLNWKQEGLFHDSACINIDNHLVALGLLFYRLTGPYWQLLGKGGHYLDFFRHIVDMKEFLQRWELDATDAFDADFPGLFGVEMELKNDPIFQSLRSVPEDRQDDIRAVLRALSSRFLKVVYDQLQDFLPGGRYHDVQDPDLQQKLKHSKLTNLVSEQSFGDLDYSVFKRRNASTHMHSSINMLKRNNTLTQWFNALSPEEQKSALQKAAALHETLRKKKRTEEKAALERRKEILQQTRAKKEALEEKKRQQKLSIIDQLKKHGGPCTSAADVKRVLCAYKTLGDKKKAIQAELLYLKVIQGHKSPLLATSRKLPQIVANLRQFLGGAVSDFDSDSELDMNPPSASRKRRRLSQSETEDEDQEEHEEVSQDEESEIAVPDFNFKFHRTGCFVAVGYEDQYYVGEVEEVKSEISAIINFMEQCDRKKTVFKWPDHADRVTVDAQFVIDSNLNLTTTTGRFWTLKPEELKSIAHKYAAFRLLYFS